jgi:hypothetical protein
LSGLQQASSESSKKVFKLQIMSINSMEKQFRYQVTKGGKPIGEKHLRLRDAVLMAASYGGHAAKFIRDKHGFMCFYASRHQMNPQEYVPAPCDAFRPWSPLKDEAEAEEHVARMIVESGLLHSKHKDLGVVTLTYQNNVLTDISSNAPPKMRSMLGMLMQ